MTRRGRSQRRRAPRFALLAAVLTSLLLPQLASGGSFAVSWQTTVAKTGDCEVTVTVPIEIYGSEATPELARQWQAEMSAKWNGPTAEMVGKLAKKHDLDPEDINDYEELDAIARRVMATGGVPTDATIVDCCTIKFVFDVRVRGEAATRGYHQIEAVPEFEDIEVKGEPRKRRTRDFVRGASGAHYFDRTGKWGAGAGRDSAAAHEVGHLMGLDDEYDDVYYLNGNTGKPAIHPDTGQPIVSGAEPHPGHETDVMADNSQFAWPTEDGIRTILAMGRVRCNCCPGDEATDSSWLMERVDNAGLYLEDAITSGGTEMLEVLLRSLDLYEGRLETTDGLSWFDRSFLVDRIDELRRRARAALDGKPADDRSNAPVIDLLDLDPTWINPPGSEGPRDSGVQIMILLVSHNAASKAVTVTSTRRRAPAPGLAHLSAWWEPPFAGALAAATTGPFGASGAGQQSPAGVTMFLTSLGASSGEAFTGQIVNNSATDVTLLVDGLIIEPMQAAAQQAAGAALAPLADAATSLTLDAFCLEPLAEPPSAGTMFRVADQALQERFAPMREVLRAAERAQQAGLLNPDSDPAAYFTSIRQWALWTVVRDLDLDSFTEELIRYTQRNAEATGFEWSAAATDMMRSVAPGRWNDIQAILDGMR